MGKPSEKTSDKQPEKQAAKPIIKTIGDHLSVFCPFCQQWLKDGKPGKLGKQEELALHIAFARHAPTCEFNPDYQESETTKFIKKFRGDTK